MFKAHEIRKVYLRDTIIQNLVCIFYFYFFEEIKSDSNDFYVVSEYFKF